MIVSSKKATFATIWWLAYLNHKKKNVRVGLQLRVTDLMTKNLLWRFLTDLGEDGLELASPISQCSDMDAHVIVAGSRGDGERMPVSEFCTLAQGPMS